MHMKHASAEHQPTARPAGHAKSSCPSPCSSTSGDRQMTANGSALDGSASSARGKLTWREIAACPTIRESTCLSSEAVKQAETYWDLADLIGTEATRELLHGKDTFDKIMPHSSRRRAVDILVVRWKGRKLRQITEEVLARAIEEFVDKAEAVGIEISGRQAAVSYLGITNA